MTYAIAPSSHSRVSVYQVEGWGLTHDDHRLILSDGFSKSRSWILRLSSSADEVFDGDARAENLNELEFGEGKIYAKVLSEDRIAVIQPNTPVRSPAGSMSRNYKLACRRFPQEPLHPVMNGTAYDAAGRELFVTGKLWPKVSQIWVRLQ